jgi:hypothetical protein
MKHYFRFDKANSISNFYVVADKSFVPDNDEFFRECHKYESIKEIVDVLTNRHGIDKSNLKIKSDGNLLLFFYQGRFRLSYMGTDVNPDIIELQFNFAFRKMADIDVDLEKD